LQQQIYSLQDAAAAQTLATQAAEAEAQRAAAVAQQRAGLEQQLLQLQGNTNALRALELAGLDASNRALQQRIYDLTDQRAAEQSAAQAAADAQRAAEQLRDSWRSITDTLLDEVARIRGTSLQTPASLAVSQARFATATAQARAGDQEAARQLPELSRAVLELVANRATSGAELQRAQAQIAASMQATAMLLMGRNGLSSSTGAPAVDVGALLAQVAATAPLTSLAANTPSANTAAASATTALADEVRALRGEVQQLRESGDRTMVASERTRDILEQVTERGRAMQTESAT
ncbi:hypothetical protein LNV47_18070, partial [Paucibacter sp. DJ4R-1]|nr:hypothetical protein [Paucibacter sp. DJ4R-1]